jgi:hypothetical protein
MKRPLLLVGLLYVAGILAGEYFPLPHRLLLSILGGLTVLAIVWGWARASLLYPILILAGWTNIVLEKAMLSPVDLRQLLGEAPQIVTVRGLLLETPVIRSYETEDRVIWRTQSRLAVTALRPNKGATWPSERGAT